MTPFILSQHGETVHPQISQATDGVMAMTDFHKTECQEALNDIKLRMRVERSDNRWNKDGISALKNHRKILQTHVNKLNAGADVKQEYLRQVDNDLKTYRTLKV